MNDRVVYVITVDGIHRYYGEGLPKRPRAQLLLYRPVVATFKPDAMIKVSILHRGLTKEQAIAIERELIRQCPKGQLWNRNSGGGGSSSEMMKRINGRKSVRQKHSTRLKALWKDPEFRSRMLASRSGKMSREITDKQRLIMSESMKAHWANMPKDQRQATMAKVNAGRLEK